MAKSKSSTKVTAQRTAAKGSRKGPAEPAAVGDNPPAAPATGRARETKQALVLGLLQRKQGASLAELVAATGWLPHTTRFNAARGNVLIRVPELRLQIRKRGGLEVGADAWNFAPVQCGVPHAGPKADD